MALDIINLHTVPPTRETTHERIQNDTAYTNPLSNRKGFGFISIFSSSVRQQQSNTAWSVDMPDLKACWLQARIFQTLKVLLFKNKFNISDKSDNTDIGQSSVTLPLTPVLNKRDTSAVHPETGIQTMMAILVY